MRRLAAYPDICQALAAGQVSRSFGLEIIELVTRNLPAGLRGPTAAILLAAAVAGASLDDLKVIAAAAAERWKAAHPDPDEGGFDDRGVRVETTLGGAGCLHGNLTAEWAAAVQAVLDALGKRHGPEDTRTEARRWHDALQLGASC